MLGRPREGPGGPRGDFSRERRKASPAPIEEGLGEEVEKEKEVEKELGRRSGEE